MTKTLEQSSQYVEILETDPIVSIDLKVAKRLKPGQVIDVDYPSLREVIESVGGPIDSSRLSIRLRTKAAYSTLRGSYSAYTNSLVVKLGSRKDPNLILAHELRHYADRDSILNESKSARTKYAIGSIATAASLPAFPVNVAAFAANAMSDDPNVNKIQMGVAACSIALSAIGLAGYYSDKYEKEARAAEKDATRDVIRILDTQT